MDGSRQQEVVSILACRQPQNDRWKLSVFQQQPYSRVNFRGLSFVWQASSLKLTLCYIRETDLYFQSKLKLLVSLLALEMARLIYETNMKRMRQQNNYINNANKHDDITELERDSRTNFN